MQRNIITLNVVNIGDQRLQNHNTNMAPAQRYDVYKNLHILQKNSKNIDELFIICLFVVIY